MSNTIDRTVREITWPPPPQIAEAARTRWDSLTKPRGSLGRLEEDVIRLAEIQQTALPTADRRCMYVFCGDHGITAEGVSLYPSVVTGEMMKNFVRGGAAINILCRQLSIDTYIVDAGVAGPKLEGVMDRRIANGTRNFRRESAMSHQQATTAIENGIELGQEAAKNFSLAGVGEMGIGNSTAASAILCLLTGATPEGAVGRGTGLDNAGLLHKREVIAEALALHRCDASDPIAIVTAVGGFEIATMAGFILGAASRHLPVVVDGFISGSAFLIASAMCPAVVNSVFFGHRSAEHGHARLLAGNQEPILNLGMRLGEGTGAALAMGLLTSGVFLFREMATFSEASVSDIKATGENK